MKRVTQIRRRVLLAMMFVIAIVAPPAQASRPPALAHQQSTPKLYWGALLGPQFTGTQPPWSWPAVTAFERTDAGGKGMSLLHFGGPWESRAYCSGYCDFPTSVMTATRSAGVIPFYSWNTTADPGARGFSNAQIASGAQDAYITKWATAAKAWGHPFFLRFDWEMNGNWFPWAATTSRMAATYLAMWRHVHSIFTSVGATNVSWVWCPNIDPGRVRTPLSELYPGDSYVDWTCLDGYNHDAPWRDFTNLFSSTYRVVSGVIAPSKPMVIGETGSTEVGGSKARWIAAMLAALPTAFPKVHGLLWYDRRDAGTSRLYNWPIESSSAARRAFARGIANPVFASNTYADLNSAGPIPPPS